MENFPNRENFIKSPFMYYVFDAGNWYENVLPKIMFSRIVNNSKYPSDYSHRKSISAHEIWQKHETQKN